jgi:hypothetical protein
MIKRLGIVLACVLAVACAVVGSAAAKGARHSSRGIHRVAHRSAHRSAAKRRCTRRRSARGRHAQRQLHRNCGTRAKAKTKPALAQITSVKRHRKPAPSASPASSSPVWPVQTHTETWAYDDCGNGGASTSAAVVQAWVTYAESNCGPGGDAKALSDCHSGTTVLCNVIQYLDTNWIYPNGSPTWKPFSAAASANWWQHTPGSPATPVASSGYGGGNLVNQSNPAVQSFFQSYVRTNYNSDNGLMMDDQSAGLSTQLYYSTCGCHSSSEVSSDAALRAGHESMSAAMTHSTGQPFVQVDNTLPANPYLPQGLGMLNQTSGVQGLVAEGAPEDNGTLDPYYSTLLDQIAYVATQTKSFVVPLSYGQDGAASQLQSRRVQEATILLGYSPGHLVDWANLATGSDQLAVWPEEGIYPTAPVQSMTTPGGSGCLAGNGQVCSTGGHNSVQVAPGVYRREFGACYDRGIRFGECAAIVNTTAAPVTVQSAWLSHSYAHQITLAGGNVESGGTISATGTPFTAGATTVAAHDATLLAP